MTAAHHRSLASHARPSASSGLVVLAAAAVTAAVASAPASHGSAVAAASAVTQDSTPTEVPSASEIEAVTLYPGRASVTRVARPELRPGLWLLRFDDLPATVQADTLEARTTIGKVLSVDFTSRPSADRSGTAEAKALDAEIRRLEDEIATNADAAGSLESERKLVDSVTVRSGNDATKEAGTEKLDLAAIDRQMAWARDQRVRIGKAMRELGVAKDRLSRELAVARERRAELGGGRTTQGADVLVALAEAGRPEVQLSYLVRNAGWQPVYAVRALPEAGTASVEYEALITQSSGEHWNEVKLTLSTAQPSRAATPPGVDPWTVDVWAPPPVTAAPAVGAPGEPRAMMRKGRMAPGGSGGGMMPDEAGTLADAMSEAEARAAEVAERFSSDASIGGSGPAINFTILRPVTAPSDASLRTRARISTIEGPAKFVYQVQPLATDGAFLRGTIVNGSAFQLLPGQTTMFVGNDYVGSAEFPGAAPQQAFSVFFGTDAAVTVKRELLSRDEAQSGLFGGGLDTTWNMRGTILNGTGRTIQAEWIDRMPVSRSDKIQVSLAQSSAPLSTDSAYVASERPRGILRWDLTVPPAPAGAQPFALTWRVVLSRSKDIQTTPLPDR